MARPLNRIVNSVDGWVFESDILRFPLRCGCEKDAKRVAAAFELMFPHAGPAEYCQATTAFTVDAKDSMSISQ